MREYRNEKPETAESELETLKREAQARTGHRVISLSDALERYGGACKTFDWKYVDDQKAICYEIDGEMRTSEVFCDALSGERSVFLVLPIEYVYHDSLINPRPVNLRLSNLIA